MSTNKTLWRVFMGFFCLAGTLAGAYLGLQRSVMLAQGLHSEEDVTWDWPRRVLEGAVIGGFLAFAVVGVAFAAMKGLERNRLAAATETHGDDEEPAEGVWPPAPKPPTSPT